MRLPVRSRPAIALAISGALVSTCSAQPSQGAPLIDYLIQDVCVDARGTAVAGDPATCARHRDLKPGEKSQYLLTDYDRPTGTTFQATGSIPVRRADGSLMVLVFKSLQGSFDPNYRFSFLPARDAFDLIDVGQSRYASIVRTFDGGCFDQVFSHDGLRRTLADRAGGWILFPLQPAPSKWQPMQSLKHKTFRMQLVANGAACVDNHASGFTRWTRPSRTVFESGKTMSAIRNDHFAAENLAQAENSFERTYFTREYGVTRWEAWQTLAYCQKTLGTSDARCRPDDPANPWFTRCTALKDDSTGKAGQALVGGQRWVRVMCRDQTHFIGLNTPQLLLAPTIASGNGVADVSFAKTVGSMKN